MKRERSSSSEHSSTHPVPLGKRSVAPRKDLLAHCDWDGPTSGGDTDTGFLTDDVARTEDSVEHLRATRTDDAAHGQGMHMDGRSRSRNKKPRVVLTSRKKAPQATPEARAEARRTAFQADTDAYAATFRKYGAQPKAVPDDSGQDRAVARSIGAVPKGTPSPSTKAPPSTPPPESLWNKPKGEVIFLLKSRILVVEAHLKALKERLAELDSNNSGSIVHDDVKPSTPFLFLHSRLIVHMQNMIL